MQRNIVSVAHNQRTGVRGAETLLAALVIGGPAAFAPWAAQPFDLVKAVLLASCAPVLAYAAYPRHRPGAVGILTLALAGWIAFSASLFAPNLAWVGSLERAQGAITWLAFLAVFAAAATVARQRDGRRRLLWAMLCAGLVPAVYGLIQGAGFDSWAWSTDAVSPAAGTLGRSNFLGDLMAMLLPMCLAAAVAGKQRRWVLAFGVLYSVTLLATGSRAAWAGAGIGLVVTGAAMWRGGGHGARAFRLTRVGAWDARTRITVAGLAGLVVVAITAVLGWRTLWNPASLPARLTIWRWSLPLIADRPLTGYGPDVAGVLFPTLWSGSRIDRAHNLVLDTALAFGLVGVVLIATLIGLALRRGWMALSPADGAAELANADPMIAGSLGAVVAFLATSAVSFGVNATWLIFWVALGALAAAGGEPDARARKPAEPGGEPDARAAQPAEPGGGYSVVARLVAPIGVVLVTGAALAWGWTALAAAGYAARSEALRFGAAPSVGDAEQSVALAPYRPEYRIELARALLARANAGGTAVDAVNASVAAEEAERRGPRDPYIALWAGEVHRVAAAAIGSGVFADRAEAAFRRALVIDERLVDAQSALGALYLDAGRTDDAVAALQGAVAMDESHAPSYERLGAAFLVRGQNDPAAEAFARAVANDPTLAAAILGHGRALCAAGKVQEGRRRLAEAVRLADMQNDAAVSRAASASSAECR